MNDNDSGKKKTKKLPGRGLIITLIIELIALVIFSVVFIDYSKLAPKTPTLFAKQEEADSFYSGEGKLTCNKITVKVPNENGVKYSIAYSWAKDDDEYPSVPRAAVASYPKTKKKTADDSKSKADDAIAYEISLYKDAHYSGSKIPGGKDADNWFSDWDEEESDGLVKKKLTVGDINGFLISSLKAGKYSDEYRTYNFSFASSEKKGLSVYTIEGICYDPESLESFEKVMESVTNSLAE